jgi:hypothetical protein
MEKVPIADGSVSQWRVGGNIRVALLPGPCPIEVLEAVISNSQAIFLLRLLKTKVRKNGNLCNKRFMLTEDQKGKPEKALCNWKIRYWNHVI